MGGRSGLELEFENSICLLGAYWRGLGLVLGAGITEAGALAGEEQAAQWFHVCVRLECSVHTRCSQGCLRSQGFEAEVFELSLEG